MSYNTKDIFLERRTANQTFEEYPLHVYPNSVIISDANGNLAMVDTASFISGTGSINFVASASVSSTASYLLETSFTASYARTASISSTASYLLETSFTASYARTASIATSIYLDNSYITSNTASNIPSHREGQMWWDKVNHTYTIDELNSRLQIGQENYIRAIAGEFIPNGKAVYVGGSDIDPDEPTDKLPVVYLAIADGSGLKTDVVGLSTQEITVGSRGFITTQGVVHDINTGTFFDGDSLYLSDSESGSYTNTIPLYPAEKIKIGTNLYSHASNGSVLVALNIADIREVFSVGVVSIPQIYTTETSPTGSIVNVGNSKINFCTTADGKGLIRSYEIPSASFVVASSFLDVQFLIGNYNSGSPNYEVVSNLSVIDDIQTVPIATFTIGTGGSLSYVDWDESGLMLSNKQNRRIIELWGAQRASGLMLNTSASHITLTAGTGYLGVKKLTFTTSSTENTNQFVLLSHSASIWSGSFINGWINNVYDDGTNLQPLESGKFVINYVFRGIGNQNRSQVILSTQYDKYADAVEAIIPETPPELRDISILCGRIIVRQGVASSLLVESAFTTILSVAGVTSHNDMLGIQGGQTDEYYHLNSASYARVQTGNLDTASYLTPGATLYVVSASASLPSSYIEPYNIPVVPYNPPYKEGRMFYDKDYSNWVYYPDQNFKLHIGKEVIWRVHNPFTESLSVLTAVYLSGSTNGQDPDVYPAIADGSGLKNNAVGILRHDIPSGSTGYVLQVGVAHNVDMTGFNIGDDIWLSNTVPGGFTNNRPGQPYETVHIGFCQVNGNNGSIIVDVNIDSPPVSAYAGITSNILIQNNNNGTITVSTGSVNLYDDTTGFGAVTGYPLESKTFDIITGSTNYIVVEHSASLASYVLTTDATYANGISIVRVATLDIYTGNPPGTEWDIHTFNVGIVGLALANRINNKDISLYGYQRQDGLTLFTGESSGSFNITAGTIWYGPNSHNIPDFNSTSSGVDVYHFISSGSGMDQVWTIHTQSTFDNLYYNDVGGAVPLSENSWSVNFIYRLVGSSDSGYNDTAIVLSNQQFSTELEASNNAQPPSNLPSTIRNSSLLVGRFIVQSSSFSPVVESAFSNIFIPAVVTNHEDLIGLQGGQGGEHYHLTFADYTGTGTGLIVRQSKPTCSLIRHLGATAGHVPYWTNEQTLTYTGSFQVVSGQYITINSASFPDSNNPEALLVKQANTQSVNTVGAYSNINNFSQIYNQNQSSGSNASTDIVATNDTGSQTSFYIDMGIASSEYNDPRWPWTKPNDSYVEVDGGDLWLATLTNKAIRFVFNNTASTDYADKTGFYLSGSWYGTSSVSISSSVATSASWSNVSISSSNATTASFVLGIPRIKSGIIAGTSFQGTPNTASIVFTTPFSDNNYSVVVTGESSRTWTIQQKSASGFEINSNNNTAFTNNIFWQAISIGEYYS